MDFNVEKFLEVHKGFMTNFLHDCVEKAVLISKNVSTIRKTFSDNERKFEDFKVFNDIAEYNSYSENLGKKQAGMDYMISRQAPTAIKSANMTLTGSDGKAVVIKKDELSLAHNDNIIFIFTYRSLGLSNHEIRALFSDYGSSCIIFYIPETFSMADDILLYHNEHKVTPISRVLLYNIIADYKIPHPCYYLASMAATNKRIFELRDVRLSSLHALLNKNTVLRASMNSAYIGFSHHMLMKIHRSFLPMNFDPLIDTYRVSFVCTDNELSEVVRCFDPSTWIYDKELNIIYTLDNTAPTHLYAVWRGWSSTLMHILSPQGLLSVKNALTGPAGTFLYYMNHVSYGKIYVLVRFAMSINDCHYTDTLKKE